MTKKTLFAFILILTAFFSAFAYFLHAHKLVLLSPTGMIAIEERNLMVVALSVMLSVGSIVIGAMFFIAWKYRANNQKAIYKPTWTGNKLLKLTWWALPTLLVCFIAILVWKGAHVLDPYKPISSSIKPIHIQVVALDWKWLFIYPDEHIATVNFIQLPVNTPINFQLTADAPMNSFWIPSLGGQIYAMSAMETHLHLIANQIGDFPGGAAEINGAGFAGMRFIARVSSQKDYDAWIKKIQTSRGKLSLTTYNQLAIPSENTPPTFYTLTDNNLYTTVIGKYMEPNSVHMEH